MQPAKADMIAQLRHEILMRQCLQKIPGCTDLDMGLGMMKNAFPDHTFPLAAVHEFVCTNEEDKTASAGFITGLLSVLLKNKGACLWIAQGQQIFPPALCAFGIDPSRIIFIHLQKEKDQLWMMEEALKCESLSAVVGDIPTLHFTASRRLQLAVEQSRVTGFLLRQTKNLQTTACVSRWRIRSLPSSLPGGMPGVGSPRWNVDLLKIRNGKPGSWLLEWKHKKFSEIISTQILSEQERMIV